MTRYYTSEKYQQKGSNDRKEKLDNVIIHS